jgi:hypothetical protein
MRNWPLSSIASTTPNADVPNELDPDDARARAVRGATEIGDTTADGLVSNGDGAVGDPAPRWAFDCAELHALSTKPAATSVTTPRQESLRR